MCVCMGVCVCATRRHGSDHLPTVRQLELHPRARAAAGGHDDAQSVLRWRWWCLHCNCLPSAHALRHHNRHALPRRRDSDNLLASRLPSRLYLDGVQTHGPEQQSSQALRLLLRGGLHQAATHSSAAAVCCCDDTQTGSSPAENQGRSEPN
jgi:hypothetical protein